MKDITKTHARCISPEKVQRYDLEEVVPRYDSDEEINRAVESIMDMPDAKQTIESATGVISECTIELITETICEEIIEEVVEEIQEEIDI